VEGWKARDTSAPQAYTLAPWQRPQAQLIPRQSDQTVFRLVYLPWRVGGAHEFLLDQTILLHCTARRASSVRFLRESDCLYFSSLTMAVVIDSFSSVARGRLASSLEKIIRRSLRTTFPSHLSSAHPSKNTAVRPVPAHRVVLCAYLT
jgi:hypothetical protein